MGKKKYKESIPEEGQFFFSFYSKTADHTKVWANDRGQLLHDIREMTAVTLLSVLNTLICWWL